MHSQAIKKEEKVEKKKTILKQMRLFELNANGRENGKVFRFLINIWFMRTVF